ncbi:phosphomannomutase family protein [Cryptosporidium andersoni]|uniref:Phosphomannomutase n=1 Tax=Cryptosporidium andersoni TaxID=117008 RepID=A0A1J4MWT1_9CRYT|nr:phosphomannomutase family protein [Cryptosporidium andersoni]
MEKTKILILFDLDGTLTLPRKEISDDMITTLIKAKSNLCIGIVSGSDYIKIQQQLKNRAFDCCDYLFAENGVVAYKHGELFSCQNIASVIGEDSLKKLINFCLHYIADLDIPIKRGTFIEYRSGMINVSPIGRNCTYQERLEFFNYDKKYEIRKKFVESIMETFKDLRLKCSIGGQISIDIFPEGWDKRYCLNHIEDIFSEIHFFGDKTSQGGNDWEIFNDPRVIGHTVTNPQNTKNKLYSLFLK